MGTFGSSKKQGSREGGNQHQPTKELKHPEAMFAKCDKNTRMLYMYLYVYKKTGPLDLTNSFFFEWLSSAQLSPMSLT